MGQALTWRLLFSGHRVTLCNRGQRADAFGDRVERVRADRGSDAFDRALAGRSFDRVVDFAGFTGADLRRAARVLGGRVGHYVFISTGQVYLVREGCPRPSREEDYHGPVMPGPPTAEDQEDWAYGIGKREAEDALLAAGAALPSTRLRLPMVNGEADPKQRFECYLWRLLDGGPLLVPRADAIARHVYGGAVVTAIARLLEAPPAAGAAYNLAQAETPTVRELVLALAERVGARPALLEPTDQELAAAGLSAPAASRFSSRWMSVLEPARAVSELGFVHPPLGTYLDSIVAHLLATTPREPPPGYEQRAGELAWARRA